MTTDATAAPGAPPSWWRRPGRRDDLGVVAVLLLVAAWLLVSAATVAWLQVGALVVVAVLTRWRRRFPVGVPVAMLVVAAVGAVDAAVAIAVLVVAVQRRDRILVVIAAAAAVLVPIHTLMAFPAQDASAALVRVLVNLVVVVGLPLAVGAFVGTRRELAVALRERAERAEAERELRDEQARRAERARIAREMHDALAHRMSLVALHAGGLELDPAVPPDQVEQRARVIGDQVRRALTDLREILDVLRTDDIHDRDDPLDMTAQPTLAGVPRLVEASRQAGLSVRLDADLPAEPPDIVGRAAYRVVQEGLTNVHKHARGAAVTVRLHGLPGDALVVELHNSRSVGSELSGRPAVGAGSGLLGLQERVQLLGGSFDAGEDAHGGFAVRARLAWPA